MRRYPYAVSKSPQSQPTLGCACNLLIFFEASRCEKTNPRVISACDYTNLELCYQEPVFSVDLCTSVASRT